MPGRPVSMDFAMGMAAYLASLKDKKRADKWLDSEYYVFVSYSREDEEIARKVLLTLADLMISYFKDTKDINWGDDILQRVKEGIQKCTHALIIATETSINSNWVIYELGQATALDKGILIFAPDANVKLSNLLLRHHYVRTYEEIKSLFSKPRIDQDAIDDFLRNEMLKPIIGGEYPLFDYSDYLFCPEDSVDSNLVWHTHRKEERASGRAYLSTITISGLGEELRVKIIRSIYPRYEYLGPEYNYAEFEVELIYAPEQSAVVCASRMIRQDVVGEYGESFHKFFSKLAGEPQPKYEYGWRTSSSFWLEAVLRLKRLLGNNDQV